MLISDDRQTGCAFNRRCTDIVRACSCGISAKESRAKGGAPLRAEYRLLSG